MTDTDPIPETDLAAQRAESLDPLAIVKADLAKYEAEMNGARQQVERFQQGLAQANATYIAAEGAHHACAALIQKLENPTPSAS